MISVNVTERTNLVNGEVVQGASFLVVDVVKAVKTVDETRHILNKPFSEFTEEEQSKLLAFETFMTELAQKYQNV